MSEREALVRCDRCGVVVKSHDLVVLGITGGANGTRTVGLCPKCAHAVLVTSRVEGRPRRV